MNFEYSTKSLELQNKLFAFMQKNIFPLEKEYRNFTDENPWKIFPELDSLKAMAKSEGLWNIFLPKEYSQYSPGLSNLEYAPLAELMGQVLWSSQVFNCSAPDTGNMEVLAKYGSKSQKDEWLNPLLDGSIRSAFLMTEPHVASSDARNIECSIERFDDHYLINGHKWWSTGALNPNTRLFVLMGKTDPKADSFRQQSMIIIPADADGVKIIRPLKVFGYTESPEGHAEIKLNNVKVPLSNILQEEGDGFKIAQGRLGPGRIHHCMRLIGTAQKALQLMCERVDHRQAFGKKLSEFSSIRQTIAKSRCNIEQARLITLAAADKIDRFGISEALELISMIKIIVPSMACNVIDDAIQIHGGMGVCQDSPLAEFYTYARALRIADGPDEVHMYQLAKRTFKSLLL